MALIMGQAAVAGTKQIFTIPPGACSVTFYSASTAGTLYMGTSSNLSASNGYAVPTAPTTFKAFSSSQGANVYGLNSTAGTIAINYIISTEG